MVSLEAESVKGNLALLAHVDCFVVLGTIQSALLAVAALGLGLLTLTISLTILLAAAALGLGSLTLTILLITGTSAHNPVVEPIKPPVRRSCVDNGLLHPLLPVADGDGSAVPRRSSTIGGSHGLQWSFSEIKVKFNMCKKYLHLIYILI